jgi:hypothetical protein
MKVVKISMIAGVVLLANMSYGQEPEKLEFQPMKKELKLNQTPENQKEVKTEETGEAKEVKTAPVKKTEAKAVEPKLQVVEPKKD